MGEAMGPYEAVIGLEVHLQASTASKIFCGCSAGFGQAPNSSACPICLGLPGSLPALNRNAVAQGIRMALATHCVIAPYARFARKNYFYPDLPKGYQISMFELPLATKGFVEIALEGTTKKIGLTRIHMEEDAGKNLHEGLAGISHVDFNRSGMPLLEIVSEPDMRSAEEAVCYLKKLREVAVYTGASDADMEKGNLRCDVNISLRPYGRVAFGTRVELKNINSFRFIQKGIEYEIKRQAEVLNSGGEVLLETRLWDAKAGVTISMRSKEEAHDYRYFPEPDLVPLQIDSSWIEEIKKTLPELADAKRERFIREYDLPPYDAGVLTASAALADFFEKTEAVSAERGAKTGAKTISNWIMGELLRVLKTNPEEGEEGKKEEAIPLRPTDLAALIALVEEGVISQKIAKTVFDEMIQTGEAPQKIVEAKGLLQVSDEAALESIIDVVLVENPKEVAGFKAGKTKLLGFFVGEVMKKSQGKAHPEKVNQLLKEKLS